MRTNIKFAKVRDGAVIPTKRDEDAGFDIYANFDEDFMLIYPHKTSMIPTGIACACSSDYCLIAKERGSTGTKGIAQRCGVIDSGYRNEIFIPITNTNDGILVIAKKNVSLKDVFGGTTPNNCIIYPYEKAISQLLVLPVPYVDVEECTYDELKLIPSQRGGGCLGSSGK